MGFRPFYLLAAAYASLSVALWALQYAGLLPFAPIRGPAWHGHEMLFGFAAAVIVGFLLTAGRNWAQQPTLAGAPLAALAALWVAGRVLALSPWTLASAIANALFPLAAAVALAIPFVRAGNRRNYFFVALLVALSAATLGVHLSAMGAFAWPERASLRVALDVVLFIVAVMAGRVVPMFTNNGVPGAEATRVPWLERASLGAILVIAACDLLEPAPIVAPVVAVLAALLHGARLALWHPWRTRHVPLVWVLHAAYAWIPAHLVLRWLASLGVVPEPLATHALTIGVIGGMTIGMMTRTARGHTARPLEADRWEVAAYGLVQLAAVARVLLPIAYPAAYAAGVGISAAAWSAAFALYTVRYWPILTRPRLDGRPG